MRREKRWVYYCDFCGKSGRSGGHIASHEKSCTANPNRICRMCKEYGDGTPQADLGDLVKALEPIQIKSWPDEILGDEYETYVIENEEEAIKNLREVANYCPACMLTAIRTLDCPPRALHWSYQAEKAAFWSSYNDIQLDKDHFYPY